MESLATATIDWSSGFPVDPVSGDAWCDRADPLGEVRHVFLAGNDLEARWAALPTDGRFVLGEIGAGFGRSIAVLVDAFDRIAPAGATLHVISVERAPLDRAEVARGLASVGAPKRIAAELVAQWPPAVSGIHPIRMLGGRARGLLVFGEAEAVVPRLAVPGGVDAWCLDGFAPSRDGSAWTDGVLAAVGRQTAVGGTLATWSAAGRVRAGLAGAGFEVTRTAGHGAKRDMTTARMPGQWAAKRRERSTVAVVGSGLAGSAVAGSLADRGVPVVLVDAADRPPGAASANPRAIAEPVLGRAGTAPRRLRWTGWQFLMAEASRDGGESLPGGAACGVLHADLPRWRAIAAAMGADHPIADWLDAEAASDAAGVSLSSGGLLVPSAGWVRPAELVRRRRAAIERRGGVLTGGRVDGAVRAANGGWSLLGDDGVRRAADGPVADHLVDATGVGLAGVADGLPVEAARGQVSMVDATPETASLRVIASGRAACLPAALTTPTSPGRHLLASTFDHHDDDAEIRPRDHGRILDQLADGMPELAAALAGAPCVDAWAGIRRTTPDRLPLVGAVPGAEGAFVTLAHGSRGLVGGAVAGELLAARILGEPMPAFTDDLAVIDPGRFAARAARREGGG